MKKEKTYLYEMRAIYLNILSVVIFIGLVALTYSIIKLLNINFNIFRCMLFFPVLMIPYMALHEVLHAIGYIVNGVRPKNVTFGIHIEKGVFCCSCKQTATKKAVLWSLVYPLIFIGIITYIIGIIIDSEILIVLSIFNISGCIGDLIMFFAFLKIKDFKFFEYDNPIGFGIITNEDLENKKFNGLKLLDEKKYTQTTTKRITISKISIISLIIYFIIALLPIILVFSTKLE